MSKANLHEALVAAAPGGGTRDKGPPVADGVLTPTPDTHEIQEWRHKRSIIDDICSSSTYLDDVESVGRNSQRVLYKNGHVHDRNQQGAAVRRHDDVTVNNDFARGSEQLFGKYTWKLEEFSDVSKRELRSPTFDIGSFKWYILVYPHGCDVANHLSLFLCVADYDKLLPGWSHFAQFTIAVVNKDPKKTKYSDTLHRFCKKEHDWGWKKFMELTKISDGYCTNDTLVIKAQVQVIKERPSLPLCMLNDQYRRELLRVYVANVEGVIKKMFDEKRDAIVRLLSDSGFLEFWDGLDDKLQSQLTTAPAPRLLKDLVKHFFNEKEVTSTLIIDSLYCAAKCLDIAGRNFKLQNKLSEDVGMESCNDILVPRKAASNSMDSSTLSLTKDRILIDSSTNTFMISGNALDSLHQVVTEPFHQAAEKVEGAPLRYSSEDGEATSCDLVEKDEKRLIHLGIRAMEVFVAAHITESRLKASWIEAETIKRQEELIREEEEAGREEAERAAAKSEAERERKARKKERQRAKKEAERARKEAEEAEKMRIEEEKKLFAARKQQEAEERRKQEQEAREAQKRNQIKAARQQKTLDGSGTDSKSIYTSKMERKNESEAIIQEEGETEKCKIHDGFGERNRAESQISSSTSISEESQSATDEQTPQETNNPDSENAGLTNDPRESSSDSDSLAMINAMQRLKIENDDLHAQLAEKEAMINTLLKRIMELENQIPAPELRGSPMKMRPEDLKKNIYLDLDSEKETGINTNYERSVDFSSVNSGKTNQPEMENTSCSSSNRREKELGKSSSTPSDVVFSSSRGGPVMHASSSILMHGATVSSRRDLSRQSNNSSTPSDAHLAQVLQSQNTRPRSANLPTSPMGRVPPHYSPSGPISSFHQIQQPNQSISYPKTANLTKQPTGFNNVSSSYSAVVAPHNRNRGADILGGHNTVNLARGTSQTLPSHGFGSGSTIQHGHVTEGQSALARTTSGGVTPPPIVHASDYEPPLGTRSSAGVESPGLDDFAHMGLITDLLD